MTAPKTRRDDATIAEDTVGAAGSLLAVLTGAEPDGV